MSGVTVIVGCIVFFMQVVQSVPPRCMENERQLCAVIFVPHDTQFVTVGECPAISRKLSSNHIMIVSYDLFFARKSRDVLNSL